ncbi:MAG TPA: hypothetical protein VG167_15730 [Verrucomicrobiae bacterium]|nr:hypothetical protein [Verrucomicrobiae bacterium]
MAPSHRSLYPPVVAGTDLGGELQVISPPEESWLATVAPGVLAAVAAVALGAVAVAAATGVAAGVASAAVEAAVQWTWGQTQFSNQA